ncbi:hypothetical protein U0070_004032 [Myodes glareolus]|uniref:Uncharacterized protein n=1 Tax=Myodes glareolus TaxID=447135 RepID=A0AAW0KDP7_MYOGA
MLSCEQPHREAHMGEELRSHADELPGRWVNLEISLRPSRGLQPKLPLAGSIAAKETNSVIFTFQLSMFRNSEEHNSVAKAAQTQGLRYDSPGFSSCLPDYCCWDRLFRKGFLRKRFYSSEVSRPVAPIVFGASSTTILEGQSRPDQVTTGPAVPSKEIPGTITPLMKQKMPSDYTRCQGLRVSRGDGPHSACKKPWKRPDSLRICKSGV